MLELCSEDFLDMTQMTRAVVQKEPFTYAVIKDLLTKERARQLRSFIPKKGFYRSTREYGSDKTYNVANNILHGLGEEESNDCPKIHKVWRSFLAFLQSDRYRRALSQLLDIDLSQDHLELTLKQYHFNDFISSHTDRSWVDATHLFFFNDNWQENWGGLLQFLTNDGEVFFSMPPIFNSSVAFVRSDVSWHQVTPIKNRTEKRFALQVAFWNTLDRHVLPGRITQPEKENCIGE